MDDGIENKAKLEFAIFCIENVAIRLHRKGSEIYTAFAEESSLLYDYMLSNYEILHTQDKEYIINDILAAAKEQNIQL